MAKQGPLSHQQTEQLLAVYRDLSSHEKRAVAEHLAACQRCTTFAENNRKIDNLLKQSARKKPDPRVAENFYKAIETDGRSWFQTFTQLGGQFAGIAVLMIVVLSLWFVIRNETVQTPIEPPTLAASPTPASTLIPAATPDPGTSLQPLYTLTQTVSLFALGSQGSYLATAENNTINIWDAVSGYWLNTAMGQSASNEPLDIESMNIETMSFTPNGVNLVARDTSGQFHRWLAYNGSYQRQFEGPQSPIGTPFALGNTSVLIVTADNNLEVWPLVGSQPNIVIKTSGEPIADLAISSGGQAIGVIMQDGSTYLWNEYNNTLETLVDAPDAVKGLVFAKNGRQFATFQDNAIQLWQENKIQHWLSPEAAAVGSIQSVQFADQDGFLMVSYSGGFLQFWDINTGRLIKTFHSQLAKQTAIALTRKGFLYLTIDSQDMLTVWEKPEE